MFKLSDVYQSFLGAMMRFWDKWFQMKTDPLLDLLRMQLEIERAEKAKLLNLIAELASKSESAAVFEAAMPAAIGKPHWTVRARELEKQSREENERLKKEYLESKTQGKKLSIEDLESELGVG